MDPRSVFLGGLSNAGATVGLLQLEPLRIILFELLICRMRKIRPRGGADLPIGGTVIWLLTD